MITAKGRARRSHACVDVPRRPLFITQMQPTVVPTSTEPFPCVRGCAGGRHLLRDDAIRRSRACARSAGRICPMSHACVDVPRQRPPPFLVTVVSTRAWMCRLRSFDPVQGRSCRLPRAWMRRTRRRRASSPSRPRPRAGRVPSTAADRPKEYAMPYILEKSSLPRQVDVVAGRQQRRCPIVPRASMCRRRTHNGPTCRRHFHASRGCTDCDGQNAAVSTRLHACTWMYRRRPPHAPAGCRAATSAWMYRSLGHVGLSPVPRAWMCRRRIETRRRTTMRGL